MANNKRRAERRLEIQKLRAEGRAAFEAGKSIHAMPQRYVGTMNMVHWADGFNFAKSEHDAKEDAEDER